MKFREMTEHDLPAVKSLIEHNHNYPMPDLYNPLYATKNIITNGDDVIIAFGSLKLTCEAITAVDYSMSNDIRLEAIKILWELAKARALLLGFDEVIAAVHDGPMFEKFLEKRFDFHKCNGTIMSTELNHAKR